MARLNFTFNVLTTVDASFDPAEFVGLNRDQIATEMRISLPQGNFIDPDGLRAAAETLMLSYEAARG